MTETLKFRKIHVDSRRKSFGTHSNFSFDLKETFDTPEGTICYCDNALIPHSWQTVTAQNQNLYIAERHGIAAPYIYGVRKVQLPVGNHSGISLRSVLETALNTNVPIVSTATWAVVYSASTNKLSIASPSMTVFHILSDDEIKNYDNALLTIDKNNPASANGIIRNREGYTGNTATAYNYVDVWTTPFVDLLNHHAVYIHSNLSSFNVCGPEGGSSDIICKIPVSSSWGTMIFHAASTPGDFADVGRRSLTSLQFALRDGFGNEIDLQGGSWSLSLVFAVRD